MNNLTSLPHWSAEHRLGVLPGISHRAETVLGDPAALRRSAISEWQRETASQPSA